MSLEDYRLSIVEHLYRISKEAGHFFEKKPLEAVVEIDENTLSFKLPDGASEQAKAIVRDIVDRFLGEIETATDERKTTVSRNDDLIDSEVIFAKEDLQEVLMKIVSQNKDWRRSVGLLRQAGDLARV